MSDIEKWDGVMCVVSINGTDFEGKSPLGALTNAVINIDSRLSALEEG